MRGWLARLLGGGAANSVNPANQQITGQFVLQAALAGSSGRSMNITGYIYDGESVESLNERLDQLQEVIERQRTRAEIPELEAKREQMIKGVSNARDVLVALEEKQRASSLSTSERQQVGNMRVSIAKMLEEIDKGEAAIAEAKKRAGVG